jgi:two-component system phosphate regulon sensor histidine kinase PhoR
MRFGFAALIVFLLLAATVQLIVLGRARPAADGVRTLETLELSNTEVFQYFTEADSALRAYLLTSDPTYLAAYRTAFTRYQTTQAQVLAKAPDATVRKLIAAEQKAVTAWSDGYAAAASTTTTSRADSRQLATDVTLLNGVDAAHQAVGAALASRVATASDRLSTRQQTAKVLGLVLTFAAVMLSVLVALRLVREVAGPLDAVSTLLRRLDAGEHGARVPTQGPPAVRKLLADANKVAAEVEQAYAEQDARLMVRRLAEPDGSRAPDMEAALSDVVQRVGTALVVDRVFVRVTEGLAEGDERLALVAQWHREGLEVLDEQLPLLPRDPRSDGPLGMPDAHQNLRADPILYGDNPRARAARELATQADARALVSTQITAAAQVCGALMAIDSKGPRGWTTGELDLLTAVTADLGRIIENAKLAADQRRLTRDRQVFTATASHELRTPLASILGYLELLAVGDFGELTDEQLNAIAVVERNTARLHELVRDLLTISGIAPMGDMSDRPPVDLGELAAAVRGEAAPMAAQARVELRYTERSPATVLGDARQIERALTALVHNAIAFTPVGGSVLITLDQDVAPASYEGAGGRAGDSARLTVSDTGIGIPEAELTRVIEPFYRGSNAVQQGISGSGLGLAITAMVIEQHGGTLALNSRPGQGTDATIRIPLAHFTSAGASTSWAQPPG